MTESRKLSVFLCHSSQDKPIVRELYQRLLAESWIDPWLDEENLLPGQDWGIEIEKAVEATDVVIVCLSTNSVTKEGFVQRELKFVLDIALEKPEGTIFIVPLRLNDCQPPRRLRSWHYTDYFPVEKRNFSFEKMKKSFRFRLAQLVEKGLDTAEDRDSKAGVGLNEESRFVDSKDKNIYPQDILDDSGNASESKLQAFFMPFSIGLETLNGVFTPVISRGDRLPAEEKVVFSTAEDNQKRVEIHVLLGENMTAKNNLSLGRFGFGDIPPAPRGIPQIEFQFIITRQLELRFVVVDLTSGRIENYKPINLGGLTPPLITDPFSVTSEDDRGNVFSEFFDTIFNTKPTKDKSSGNYQYKIDLPFEEAVLGTTKKIRVENKEYLVKIPAGVSTGTQVRVGGVLSNKKGSKDDLYLVVTVLPHSLFERKDLDLYLRYPISPQLAILGGELPVPKLGQRGKLIVKIPSGTQSNQTFRFAGKGISDVKNPGKVGDFYLTVETYDRKNISQEHKKLLDDINNYLQHIE